MISIALIAHNLRSSHNVGSLLRTADGLGVQRVCLTGYTPYPLHEHDRRLPHLAARIDARIAKTALGAERSVAWEHHEDIFDVLAAFRSDGFIIVGLEQSPAAVPLHTYIAPAKLALVIGREVEGLEAAVIEFCDRLVEIPMAGRKESFNVVQAAAMALYHFRFSS